MADDLTLPTPTDGEGSPADPYREWFEKAGLDPNDVDPQYAAQGIEYWRGLNHRDTADRYLESTLQQRGVLPEGVSLSDVQAWAAEQGQAEDVDPWEQFEVADDETGDAGDEYVGEYRQPAPFDPASLRPVFESEAERIKREVLEQVASQQAQQAAEAEFRAELERLRLGEHKLPQQAAFGVMVQANDLAQSMPNASLRERAEKAVEEYQREVDSYIAQRAEQQAKVNAEAKSIPTGPPPADRQPVGSLEELLEREVASGS